MYAYTEYQAPIVSACTGRDKDWRSQPRLIQNLKKKIGEQLKKLREYKTPCLHTARDQGNHIVSPVDDQKDACVCVGMLLHIVRYPRLDIVNPVRKLFKVLDCSTNVSCNEMLGVSKYILGTRTLGPRTKSTELHALNGNT